MMTGVKHEEVVRRVVTIAAKCKNEPLAHDRIKAFAENNLGYSRSAFNHAVKDARGRIAETARELAKPTINSIKKRDEKKQVAGNAVKQRQYPPHIASSPSFTAKNALAGTRCSFMLP